MHRFQPAARTGPADVWWFLHDLTDPAVARAAELLSPAERDRADRMGGDPARRGFVVSRAGVRQLLAAYAACPPSAVPLRFDDRGKPFLPDGPHVNWSTSHDVTAVAFCSDRAVGVDVEQIRPLPDAPLLAHRWLGPEAAAALARERTPDGQARSFLSAWTAREAYAKATGEGLRDEPGGWAIDPSTWELHPFQGAGWLGAVVVGRERPGSGSATPSR